MEFRDHGGNRGAIRGSRGGETFSGIVQVVGRSRRQSSKYIHGVGDQEVGGPSENAREAIPRAISDTVNVAIMFQILPEHARHLVLQTLGNEVKCD